MIANHSTTVVDHKQWADFREEIVRLINNRDNININGEDGEGEGAADNDGDEDDEDDEDGGNDNDTGQQQDLIKMYDSESEIIEEWKTQVEAAKLDSGYQWYRMHNGTLASITYNQ